MELRWYEREILRDGQALRLNTLQYRPHRSQAWSDVPKVVGYEPQGEPVLKPSMAGPVGLLGPLDGGFLGIAERASRGVPWWKFWS